MNKPKLIPILVLLILTTVGAGLLTAYYQGTFKGNVTASLTSPSATKIDCNSTYRDGDLNKACNSFLLFNDSNASITPKFSVTTTEYVTCEVANPTGAILPAQTKSYTVSCSIQPLFVGDFNATVNVTK